jgi:hypothetical protein
MKGLLKNEKTPRSLDEKNGFCVGIDHGVDQVVFVGIGLPVDPRNGTEPATHTAGKPVPYKNAGDGFRRIGPGGAA